MERREGGGSEIIVEEGNLKGGGGGGREISVEEGNLKGVID